MLGILKFLFSLFQVKPVRDSMIEALQLLKNIKGEDANSEDPLGIYCIL